MPRGLLRPFDQADGIVAEIFGHTSISKLFWIIETIKIKVIPVYARNYVNFNQGVSRAFHGTGVTKAPQQGTNQRGLTCTKISVEPDNHAGGQYRRNQTPKRIGCRLIWKTQC